PAQMIRTAAITQYSVPEPRRPSGSISAVMLNRPRIPARLTKIIRKAACAGLVLRTMTSKRSEEHTSELQSRGHLVCPLLLEKHQTYSFPIQSLASARM